MDAFRTQRKLALGDAADFREAVTGHLAERGGFFQGDGASVARRLSRLFAKGTIGAAVVAILLAGPGFFADDPAETVSPQTEVTHAPSGCGDGMCRLR